MQYLSTRNSDLNLTFEDTLLSGMAADGGLYIPREWPQLKREKLQSLKDAHYAGIAAFVVRQFCGESISEEDLAQIIKETYNSNIFEHPDVAPLVQIEDNLWIMELFHGPTLAFKDYALQLLGRLFDHVLKKRGEKVTIVGATSGDTGSAAIEACRHCENINIFILHPRGKTSKVQRKQMTTINAPNVKNIALEGTFDDCQAIVKSMFADETFRNEVNLSAVNSINWARICAQIAYYVAASVRLGADQPVSFSVPTGNFGNVFAAHCARNMGLNIQDLIIGTNKNDILTRFFRTGEMKKGVVEHTNSPSMDIQISSNFERYLFELMDKNASDLSALMAEFSKDGHMSVSKEKLEIARSQFKADRCDEEQTLQTIADIYQNTGYLLDPHSAVGVHAAKSSNVEGNIVSLACAHPAKFPDAVEKAIGKPPEVPDRLATIMDLPEFVVPLRNDLDLVKDYVKDHI